jgi:hypothetical protein
MIFTPEQGVEVWLTNLYICDISTRVLELRGRVRRVIFLGFDIDADFAEEVIRIRDFLSVEVYDNSLPAGRKNPEYRVCMELADEMSAEGGVRVHLFERYRVRGLATKVQSGSFLEVGTLIILNDGFTPCDQGESYDADTALNSLYALFQGLGYFYSGMETDADVLSHIELAKSRGIELERVVSDTGWLIQGVIYEYCKLGDEWYFIHLRNSLIEDLISYMKKDEIGRQRLEFFIFALIMEWDELGPFTDA